VSWSFVGLSSELFGESVGPAGGAMLSSSGNSSEVSPEPESGGSTISGSGVSGTSAVKDVETLEIGPKFPLASDTDKAMMLRVKSV
jgi:hypothetical protein